MLSEQIQRITGKSALKYAQEKLFKPLQINDYEWETLSCGLTDTDGGLHMLPRDMAKLGQLYLNKRKWKGEQIVSKKWIELSTQEQIISEGMPNYGFQWWCGNFHYKRKSSYTFFASGHGGQKIYVFPEFEAVIIITHKVFDNNFGELNNIKILSNYILPAFDDKLKDQKMISLTNSDLEKFVGSYANGNDIIKVSLKNNILVISDGRNPTLNLKAIAENVFISTIPEGVDVRFLFNENDKKEIIELQIFFSFREMKYSKN